MKVALGIDEVLVMLVLRTWAAAALDRLVPAAMGGAQTEAPLAYPSAAAASHLLR